MSDYDDSQFDFTPNRYRSPDRVSSDLTARQLAELALVGGVGMLESGVALGASAVRSGVDALHRTSDRVADVARTVVWVFTEGQK